MKRHRVRGRKFTSNDDTAILCTGTAWKRGGSYGGPRLRIQEGVFEMDRVGSLPTEETGSSAVYLGIPVPVSTVFTHP